MLKTQRVMRGWSFIISFGIYFARKDNKNHKNGGKSMNFKENDEVFTTEDAIQYLKISKPTFLKYIRLGRIRAIKAGKGWRVLHSELIRFLGGEMSE
jgi:excisionase family DNA binding protein